MTNHLVSVIITHITKSFHVKVQARYQYDILLCYFIRIPVITALITNLENTYNITLIYGIFQIVYILIITFK